MTCIKIKYFIVSLMILSASYAGGPSSSDYEEFVHEGTPQEVRISKMLSVLVIEINRKFDAMQENLSYLKHDMDLLKRKNFELDEKLENKLDMLGKKHHDLEGNINEKLNKLENNIIDRLEVYIDGKTDYLAKHIYRKIDTQETILPKITDIKVIADKLAVLQTNQANLDTYITCKPQKVSNDTMESMNKEITQKFNEIRNNIFELKNTTPDFNLNLNKNIIKLEEKIDLLEKKLNNQTDTLEDKIADIHVRINGNDELKKCQTELNGSIMEKLTLIVNATQGKLYDKINKKLKVIEENVSEIKNVTALLEHTSLDRKLTNLEDGLNREMNKIIPIIKDNIERKLDALDNKTAAHFEDNLNVKLNAMEKNILTIKHNIICNADVSNNTILPNKEQQLTEMFNNDIPIVQKMTNKTTDASGNEEKDVLAVDRASAGCKERVINSGDIIYYRLGNKSLRHVPVSYDSAGDLTSFEMHLRIKGSGCAYMILTSSEPRSRYSSKVFYYIFVGDKNNKETYFWYFHNITNTNPKKTKAETPNILSPSEYTAFYVKINNGLLQFGKEGGPPILELPDPSVREIKYFAMSVYDKANATFLYDC